MAFIDRDGLLRGERLAACSDLAQMLWPRFFVAANGYGRLELSQLGIFSEVFGHFRNPPTPEEVHAVFLDYEANCLAILYPVNGVLWCQFATSDKYLPRYKTSREKLSPAPGIEREKKLAVAYATWKVNKSFGNRAFESRISENDPISENSRISENSAISENDEISEKEISEKGSISEKGPFSVVVGVGVGVGEEHLAPSARQEPAQPRRHAQSPRRLAWSSKKPELQAGSSATLLSQEQLQIAQAADQKLLERRANGKE
jgi:hypothetical protein